MTRAMTKQLVIGRNFVWFLLATLALTTGLSFVPITGSGQVHAAANCRIASDPAEKRRYPAPSNVIVGQSFKYTIPSWSRCHDINVRNVTNKGNVTDKHCAFFRVRFYPSSGGNYANSWHAVCSTGKSGTVVPIATHVLDGTKYRVEYMANGAPKGAPAASYELID